MDKSDSSTSVPLKQDPSTNPRMTIETNISENRTPVELDGSPITEKLAMARSTSAEPGAEEEDWEELSGEKPTSRLRIEERALFLKQKSNDPAVLVNIPLTPDAQDYEAVENVQQPQLDKSSLSSVNQVRKA